MTKPIARCALIAALILAACSEPLPSAEPPRAVRTIVISPGAAESQSSYSGEVRARHESPLGFRIPGKLIERLVDAGAVVKAGQPLARLDPADMALQAAQAQALLAQAEADAQRFRELRAKNFISQSALDAHETALKAAQAQAGIAHNQEGYATLRANAAGVVAAVLAEPGQVVAAGMPVLMLARDGAREVAISLPESAVTRFKVGDAAEISLWASADDNPGKIYRGRIRELSPAADPVTRSYPVRVALLDADDKVALGMSAKVSFRARNDDSVLIPAAAILQQGEQPAVWLVAGDGTVSLRQVKVLSWRDDMARIGAGLNAGERIVERGVHKLHAGEKILYVTTAK